MSSTPLRRPDAASLTPSPLAEVRLRARRTLASPWMNREASAGVEEPAGACEHGVPHRGRELARLRVLPARVEAREQRHAAGEVCLGAVPESWAVAGGQPLPPSTCLEPRVVADAAEHKHDACMPQQRELGD